MRLWHKDLIPYLPNKQLLGQWRELIAIMRDWKREDQGIKKKGAYAHKHPLVKYITEYQKAHFYVYSNLIYIEMYDRGFKVSQDLLKEISLFCVDTEDTKIEGFKLYHKHHTLEYKKICAYNLFEKFNAGMITDEEWSKLLKVIAWQMI